MRVTATSTAIITSIIFKIFTTLRKDELKIRILAPTAVKLNNANAAAAHDPSVLK